MVALFSALLVLKIRQGKVKDALDDANKYDLKGEFTDFSELLNRPYSQALELHHYAHMLAQFIALQRELGHT